MTTPQGMSEPPDGEAIPDEVDELMSEQNFLYRAITRLLGWLIFMGFLVLTGGLLVFISLALYKGILWLWPGGGA